MTEFTCKTLPELDLTPKLGNILDLLDGSDKDQDTVTNSLTHKCIMLLATIRRESLMTIFHNQC